MTQPEPTYFREDCSILMDQIRRFRITAVAEDRSPSTAPAIEYAS